MIENEDEDKNKSCFKVYVNKEEKEILIEAKKMFGTQSGAIRQGIYLLKEKYFKELTKEMKPRYKRIAKKVNNYNIYRNSPEMSETKLSYKDTHTYIRLINYSYKLLNIHGESAKKPILENIRNMKKYFSDNQTKRKLSEFEFKVKHNFQLLWQSFLETKWYNLNFKKQKNMEISFSDTILNEPRVETYIKENIENKKIQYKNDRIKRIIERHSNKNKENK